MGNIETKLTAAREISLGEQSIAARIPEGHARISLAYGSLCGTDLHYYKDFANAGFLLRNPVTLGHEACGVVTDPNGTNLEAGQLVALNPIMNCGECEACQRGEENLCTAKKFPGSATTVPHLDGFFRTHIDHPARCCRPVGPDVKPEHLTFAEPLACALHSLNKGGVTEGSKVLVTGCGPMGLLAIAGAAARGADVTCLDIRKKAVEVGIEVGAKHGLVIGQFEPSDIEAQFDVIVEASGALPAFDTALKAAKRKGTISILSNVQFGEASLHLNLIMLKELSVVGSFQFNKEFEEAVQMIEEGKLNFPALTADIFPLDKTKDALELMASGNSFGKILIKGME